MANKYAIGQLRHLYKLMVNGDVKDQREAARGLLGPAIERLEKENEPNVDHWKCHYCGFLHFGPVMECPRSQEKGSA